MTIVILSILTLFPFVDLFYLCNTVILFVSLNNKQIASRKGLIDASELQNTHAVKCLKKYVDGDLLVIKTSKANPARA